MPACRSLGAGRGEGAGGRRLREPLARRGVDPSTSSGQACGEPVEPSPLPFIPSHRREGRFLGDILEKVRDKFSDFIV